MVDAVLVVFLILFIMSTIALSVTTAVYYNRNKTCQEKSCTCNTQPTTTTPTDSTKA
jgi:hypothetical protein